MDDTGDAEKPGAAGDAGGSGFDGERARTKVSAKRIWCRL